MKLPIENGGLRIGNVMFWRKKLGTLIIMEKMSSEESDALWGKVTCFTIGRTIG